MPKIYIDGQVGTTGLEIYQRLSQRKDIELMSIPEEKRKDLSTRKEFINSADLVFLCLPDAASIEAVGLIENPNVKVIDASTAHRTKWTYGFSELGFKEEIQKAHFVANPGCHASGCISILYPLIQKGIIDANTSYSLFSLTGYSGGGKKMIHQYENEKEESLEAPRIYGLNQSHKHLPEVQTICGLNKPILLNPIVSDYYRGMATNLSLPIDMEVAYECLSTWYSNSPMITVFKQTEGMISANHMAGKDSMQIIISGNNERCSITSLFDNLGKGACGAAIQNMNIMLGCNETEGLVL